MFLEESIHDEIQSWRGFPQWNEVRMKAQVFCHDRVRHDSIRNAGNLPGFELQSSRDKTTHVIFGVNESLVDLPVSGNI